MNTCDYTVCTVAIGIYVISFHEGLIQIVEEIVMIEHALSPNKPIYLLGESFGGTLALAVAARNPNIDLILILANPGQSFSLLS